MLNTKYWAQPLLPLWNLHHWCSFTVSMFFFYLDSWKRQTWIVFNSLNNYHLKIKFTIDFDLKKAFFLELKIFLRTIQPLTLTLSLQTGINIFTLHLNIHIIPNAPPWGTTEYVHIKKIWKYIWTIYYGSAQDAILKPYSWKDKNSFTKILNQD